jgi:uncharacterized RDD family membrane protein YckC
LTAHEARDFLSLGPMGEGSAHNPFAPPTEEADFPLAGDRHETRHLATLWQRLAGAIIDGLLSVATAIPGAILYFGVYRNAWAEAMTAPDSAGAYAVVMRGFAIIMVGPTLLAAYQWYLVTKTGQTLAKRWLQMRIVREDDGALPGFVHGVVLRNWLFFAGGFVPYVGGCVGLADALAIFFGEHRQTLHDRVTRTVVVRA